MTRTDQPVTFQRVLSLKHLVFFGMAFMAPFAIFTMYGVVTEATRGMLPTAFLLAMIAMLFTAYSYGQMVKAYPISGSSFTYTQKSIHPNLGFLVGWSILLDYCLVPMIVVLIGGFTLADLFPAVPATVWTLLLIIIITMINIFGISVTAKVNILLVLFQFLVLAIFIGLSIKGILQENSSVNFSLPFFNPNYVFSNLMLGVAIACQSFLGFDGITTLSEETIEPKKNIPRAIFIAALITGSVFIIVGYLGNLIYPDYTKFPNPDTAANEIIKYIGGNLFSTFYTAVLLLMVLSVGTASQVGASRVLYTMGREGLLPKRFFCYSHPKYKTPSLNIILIGIIALSSLLMNLVTAASLINFGAFFAFTFVNVSVFTHYYVKERRRSFKETIRYLILPMMGAIITIGLLNSLDTLSKTVGSIWIVFGFIVLLFLTKMFKQKLPELKIDDTERNEKLVDEKMTS